MYATLFRYKYYLVTAMLLSGIAYYIYSESRAVVFRKYNQQCWQLFQQKKTGRLALLAAKSKIDKLLHQSAHISIQLQNYTQKIYNPISFFNFYASIPFDRVAIDIQQKDGIVIDKKNNTLSGTIRLKVYLDSSLVINETASYLMHFVQQKKWLIDKITLQTKALKL